MSREFRLFAHFKKSFKRLAKKHRTFDEEIVGSGNSIVKTPIQGVSLGVGPYKIQLASKSKGTGKSGGFRVVTYCVEQTGDEEVVCLITIYDKLEEGNIRKEDPIGLVHDEFDSEIV